MELLLTTCQSLRDAGARRVPKTHIQTKEDHNLDTRPTMDVCIFDTFNLAPFEVRKVRDLYPYIKYALYHHHYNTR